MRVFTRRLIGCGAGVLLVASALRAQEHSYTQADIENGARLYQSSCAGCHGPNGDLVPGIDLQRGQFRRATTDTELIRIIVSGIPGTTMPPSSFTETQAGTIVAFLRSARTAGLPAGAGANSAAAAGRGGRGGTAATTGNAASGKAVFEGKGACATCHRVGASGPRVAPDLTEIGTFRQPTELHQKLIDPNAVVRSGNRFVEATTKRGVKISGRLLNQDTFTIQLLDANERLVSLSRSDLQDFVFVKNSPMPSYRDKLTQAELDDVVAYLVSLKGLRP
jgi:cytochrome c oxidase cbb3-type subunit III